ncbi:MULTISPECIES: hypothetical protein [Alphaproteobacteria]|uniref:hypothetical protein n=1 Tax=Alphaproteobacteria TaxID=28211 RepID=UPI0027334D93|nr:MULTISPECIES: hypothetical protein [Alphaproteobacteria]MDP3261950.1 hypothetical protein [Tabrizicola sp.]MDP3660858.1 hypothetical protein [Phenylobacterium sp.]MDZ4067161.1 hypothetical protein [Tabrizicola sp.]
MVDLPHLIDGDRVIITLSPGQPIELSDLSTSFAALARIYERHYRTTGDTAPKLYVTKLETGSVILEIAPLVFAMGIPILDNTIIVADFAGRLWRGLKAFSGVAGEPPRLETPTRDDAADLREFIRPLTGKMGATLGIKHAKYESDDGVRRTVVEYDFDEAQINRAAINIDEQKRLPPPTEEELPSASALHAEVMLFLEQANRGPGKEKGRTGDRGVIPDISDKVVPVYFRKGIQGIKDQMLHGDRNPFEMVYVVTVHVTRLEGEVQAYTVADIHDSFPRPD